MLRADAKTEALRRGSLFVGAVLLASWCARGLYSFAGCRFRSGVSPYPIAGVVMILVGSWLIVTARDRYLKAAAVAFVGEYIVALLSSAEAPRAILAVETILAIAGAGLLVVAGARRRTPLTLGFAAALFIGVTAFDVGVTDYGIYLFSGRSVMHAPLWRGGRCS